MGPTTPALMRPSVHLQDVCALSKRQVVQEAGKEAPKHRPLPYRRKPDGGAMSAEKLLPGSSKGHAKKSKTMDGLLLASHGIISNIRWSFASEYSLLCVPYLFD